MLDAWAQSVGVTLFPGTIYLCADSIVQFPRQYLSLARFDYLHTAHERRRQAGYAPRLYSVSLADTLLAWAYRWSDDDVEHSFIGKLGSCEAGRLLEVIAPVSIRAAIGTTPMPLRFLADDT
jgi:hypothetical protein